MSNANRKMIKISRAVEGEEAVEGFVMPSSAEVWQRNGWTVVDDGDSEVASPEAAPIQSRPQRQSGAVDPQLAVLQNPNAPKE